MLNKMFKITLMLIMTSLFLMACGDDETEDISTPDASDTPIEETLDEEQTPREPLVVEVTDEEKAAEDAVVLVVNGEEVTGKAYNDAYFNTKRYMLQNNQDVTDTDFLKEQTLTTLTSYTLLKQDAESKEITISDEDIDEAIEETKAQFESEEAYQDALTLLAFTEESFKVTLKEQLLQQVYIDEVIEIEPVTDEEVNEFYDLLKEQLEEAPALEEVRDQIEVQIQQSKLQQAFLVQIEALSDSADIEKKI